MFKEKQCAHSMEDICKVINIKLIIMSHSEAPC